MNFMFSNEIQKLQKSFLSLVKMICVWKIINYLPVKEKKSPKISTYKNELIYIK